MKTTCDISEVIRGTAKASSLLQEWPKTVEHRLREAAMTERLTHKYKNQTGHLNNSTEAGVISVTANETVIDLEMGEDYASYVVKRGKSNFVKLATRAEADLNRAAAAIARKLGKL
jgi:hypothetical protein